MRLIFATGNEHKMEEISEILEGLLPEGTEVLSMKQANAYASPEEDGSTFEDNALIKVRAVAAVLRETALQEGTLTEMSASYLPKETIVLADDSGLCIDFLDGAPGIYSARYMGHETPYEEKNLAIIDRMQGVNGRARSARFTCAVAVITPDGEEFTVTKSMEGEIAHEPAGTGGFGYDPIFYLHEYGCTDAELPPGEKNKISHRGQALRGAIEQLGERGFL